MNHDSNEALADDPRSVAEVYEDADIASSYLDKRLRFSWQRLLHRSQVRAINEVLATNRPDLVLELAPGPGRLSVELDGVKRGIMVENSEEMIAIARARLATAGLSNAWTVISGNAFDLGTSISGAKVEFAYTFRFIRHFRDNDRRSLYEQLRNQLTPSGLLMFDVVNAIMRERIDARYGTRGSGEIAIYDACYSAASFEKEMRENGFEVLSMRPIVRHFGLQSFLSYKLDDVVPRLIPPVVCVLEMLPSLVPLEWVALCRKR